MIKLSGKITLTGDFAVNLDLTQAEFNRLSEKELQAEIDEAINWKEWIHHAKIDGIEREEE